MSTPFPSTPKGKGKSVPVSQWQPSASSQAQRRELAESSPYISVATKALIDLVPKSSYNQFHDPNEPSNLDATDEPTATLIVNPPDASDASPENPFRSSRQVELFNVLEACGPAGVAHFLYEECEELKRSGETHKSLDDMLADRDNDTRYVILLLSMLPIPVIGSLIKGTLMYDRIHDPAVRAFFSLYMKNAQQIPGIYMNMIRIPEMDLSGTLQDAGRWLSPEQVNHVLDKYTDYLGGTDPAFSKEVDRCFFGQVENEPRYAANARARKIGREWIQATRKMYCDNVDHEEKDIPHMSGPSEIGWSRNLKNRIPEHSDNASTTYIFGFNNVITRLPVSKGGLGFTSAPVGVTIFPIWEKNNDLACIGEIVASALTDSLWKSGGFNCTPAGGFGIEPKTSPINWDDAQSHAMHRLQYCQAPDQLQLAALELADDMQRDQSIPQDEADLEEEKKGLQDANIRLGPARQHLEDIKAQLQARGKEFKNHLEERYEKLDARTDLPEEVKRRWRAHKRLTEASQTSTRMQEQYQKERLSTVTNMPLRVGPAAVKQPLDDEERAKVEAKMDQFNAKANQRLEAWKRKRAAASSSQQIDEPDISSMTNVTTPRRRSPFNLDDLDDLTQVTSPGRVSSSP
ncbi:MAG: hypothetical protein Q9204_000658 [Flavoplaca sp. TL-2023a]